MTKNFNYKTRELSSKVFLFDIFLGILKIRKMETASKNKNNADQTKQQVFHRQICLMVEDIRWNIQMESEAEELATHIQNLKILKSEPLQEKSDDEDDLDYNPAHDSSR